MRVSAGNKVVLIGAGDVGVAYAYALVNQGIVDHLAIIDIDERKTGGNVMDLNHGVVWAPSRTKVTSGTYADCADAALVVLCAGAAQKPGETRLQLVDKNTRIFEAIVGEHGDSELPVLSSAVVAGVGLRRKLENDPSLHDELEDIFVRTRDAAYEIIDAKGSTSYGIGMGLARITRAIIQNQEVALPVCALLRGEYGHEDIYIGTPAVVNRRGIRRVVELELDDYEKKRFDESVATLRAVQDPYWKNRADG